MPKRYEDPLGNVYERSEFGMHQDAFGNNYRMVSAGGGGLIALIAIGAVGFFIYDNSSVIAFMCFCACAVVGMIAALISYLRKTGNSSLWTSFALAGVIYALRCFADNTIGVVTVIVFFFMCFFALLSVMGNTKGMVVCSLIWLVAICLLPTLNGAYMRFSIFTPLKVFSICFPAYLYFSLNGYRSKDKALSLFTMYFLIVALEWIMNLIYYRSIISIFYDFIAALDNPMFLFAFLLFIFGFCLKKPGLAVYFSLFLALMNLSVYMLVQCDLIGFIRIKGSISLSSFVTLLALIPIPQIQGVFASSDHSGHLADFQYTYMYYAIIFLLIVRAAHVARRRGE